jgi:hypothetical protein
MEMSDPQNIRKFEYRPCRIVTGFDIDFVAGGVKLHGLCQDVSDTGIRAALDGALSVGSSGLLILRHPTGILEIEAQVANIEQDQVGLVFVFKTPLERVNSIEYVASIAAYEAASQVVRFP